MPVHHDSIRLLAARVLAVLALAGAFVVACAHVGTRADGCLVPTAVAHRGGFIDSDHTENSIEAYRAMVSYGILAWEGDFRFSAGGGAYLMHDATIDRTTDGTGAADRVAIDSTTVRLDDGQELRLQKLSRLLPLARDLGVTLTLEPKVLATDAQAAYVVGLLDTYGMRDRVILNSFHPEHLAPFKRIAPDITYSLVTSTPVTPAAAVAVGPVLNIKYSVLTPSLIAQYRNAGLRVDAWTVDSADGWTQTTSLAVDRVVSNRAGAYRGWRDARCTGTRWTS